MKLIAKLTALTLVAFLAISAFAGTAATPNTTKITLNLDQAATIAGTKLAAGEYNVYVSRNGDDATVRVTSGRRELVNTAGHFKPMKDFTGVTAIVVNGSRDILEFQSMKLKGAVVFGSTAEKIAVSEGSSR